MRHDADGHLVEIGARTRTIPPALRRALHHRDQGCRFPVAACPSDRRITSATGLRAARQRSRTSPWSVAGTTEQSTRRATKSNATPTARSGSGGPTAGPCLRRRRRPRCLTIRSRPSARARRAGPPSPRPHDVPGLAGEAPGRGMGYRRPSSAGRRPGGDRHVHHPPLSRGVPAAETAPQRQSGRAFQPPQECHEEAHPARPSALLDRGLPGAAIMRPTTRPIALSKEGVSMKFCVRRSRRRWPSPSSPSPPPRSSTPREGHHQDRHPEPA